MDVNEVAKIMKGSATKVIILSLVIIGLGGAILVGAFLEEDGFNIGLGVFGGLITALGLIAIIRTIVAATKNPLVNAIKSGDREFLVWVYNKQINTTAGHDGPTLGTSQNVVLYYKDGKNLELTLGKKSDPVAFVQFLKQEFPNAHVGYSDDTRDAVSKILGKQL